MQDTLAVALIAAAVPSIIALVSGLLGSRIGISGKTAEIDHRLKRLELIREMKKLQQNTEVAHDWAILDREIVEFLQFLDETSEAGAVRTEISKRPQSRIMQHLLLPKPQGIGAWIATVLYYLYGSTGLVYLIAGASFLVLQVETEFAAIAIPGSLGSFLFALIGRYFALRARTTSRPTTQSLGSTGQ